MHTHLSHLTSSRCPQPPPSLLLTSVVPACWRRERLFYFRGNHSAYPALLETDGLLLSFFYIQVPVSHGIHSPVQRSTVEMHDAYTDKNFLQIHRRCSAFKTCQVTVLPTLTSVLQHIRLLPIIIPLRSAGLVQPADFARSKLTFSIP